MIEFVLRHWCHSFHKKVFRPVCGKYICAECLREWPVKWEANDSAGGCSRTAPTKSHNDPALPRGVPTRVAA
jgi:hypothetical protein